MIDQIEQTFKANGRHYLDDENQLCNPWNDSKINFMLPHADTYANNPTLFKEASEALNQVYTDIQLHHISIVARGIRDALDRLIMRLGYTAIMHARTGAHYADAVLLEYKGSIVLIKLI